MEIESPRQIGFYPDRAEDCEEALRPAFEAYVGEGNSAYLDLAKVIATITPDAVAAGWKCGEILDTLCDIAVEYQTLVGSVRTQIPPAFHAELGTTRH